MEEGQHKWTDDKQQGSDSQPTQANRIESQGYQRSPSHWSASRTSSPLGICVSAWRIDMSFVTIGHVCVCAWRINSL